MRLSIRALFFMAKDHNNAELRILLNRVERRAAIIKSLTAEEREIYERCTPVIRVRRMGRPRYAHPCCECGRPASVQYEETYTDCAATKTKIEYGYMCEHHAANYEDDVRDMMI